MSTELTTITQSNAVNYEKIVTAMPYFIEMGKALAITFRMDHAQQGTVMAMTCMAEGISPTVYHARYHADGSMRATSIQAEFERRNNPIGWINLGDDGKFAEAVFTRKDGKSHTIRYTWEDAVKQVGDKINKAGSNWATNGGAMLRAALIRKAAKILDPGIIGGYDDFDEFRDQRQDPVRQVVATPTQASWTVTAEVPTVATDAPIAAEEPPFEMPVAAAIPDGDDDPVTPALLTELVKVMQRMNDTFTIEQISESMCKKWGITRPQEATCGKVRATIANVRAKLDG